MTAGSWRIAVRSITAAVVLGALWGCAVKHRSTADQPIPLAAAATPQVVAAYHLVEDGKQQLALGQTGAAIATFQKALALAPSSPHANLALGEAKLRQADYRGALVYGDRVARLVGDDPEWLWRIALLRGQAYEGVGDRTRARAAYRDVLGVDPNNVEARAGLTRVAPE